MALTWRTVEPISGVVTAGSIGLVTMTAAGWTAFVQMADGATAKEVVYGAVGGGMGGFTFGFLVCLSVYGVVKKAYIDYRAEQLREANALRQAAGYTPEPAPAAPTPEPPADHLPQGAYRTPMGNIVKPYAGKKGKKVEAAGAYASTVMMPTALLRIDNSPDGSGRDVEFIPVSDLLLRYANYGGADKPTREPEWTGDGKPFSVQEFRAMRDWMIDERKLAYWKNERAHRQGWELKARTKCLLRTVAAGNSPTADW